MHGMNEYEYIWIYLEIQTWEYADSSFFDWAVSEIEQTLLLTDNKYRKMSVKGCLFGLWFTEILTAALIPL